MSRATLRRSLYTDLQTLQKLYEDSILSASEFAVAAQVQGAPGLLQPPQSASEIPSGSVAVGSGEFRRAPILVFVGQIVHILLQVL